MHYSFWAVTNVVAQPVVVSSLVTATGHGAIAVKKGH